MWCVPADLRPFAMSMSVVAIHVLGDVPSPPLLGVLQGRLQNWRLRWVRAAGSVLAFTVAQQLCDVTTWFSCTPGLFAEWHGQFLLADSGVYVSCWIQQLCGLSFLAACR
jgi:hypothetical protein